MADRPLRIAVVGLGWAGSRQAEAATELGRDVEIVALVDNEPTHLAERAAALGVARTYPDLDAALADPLVEAVSICTPHGLHAAQTIAAARAGRHVLVEKPMALTVAEALRMNAAAREAGTVLFVAESEVYQPLARNARELVRRATIGELTFAAMVSGYRAPNPMYAGRRAWLTQPELGGTGTWYLQGVHSVAALRHVLGEVESIYVRPHHAASWLRPDLEATMSALLVLASGLPVWFVQTTETQLPDTVRGFQLYGERGVILAGRASYQIHRTTDAASAEPAADPEVIPYAQAPLSAHALELEAFAATVRGKSPGPTSGTSETRTIAVLEGGLESARTARPIDLRSRYPDAYADVDVGAAAGRDSG